MIKQIKHIAHIALVIFGLTVLATALPSCKANKCDCPTFGGHKLKH